MGNKTNKKKVKEIVIAIGLVLLMLVGMAATLIVLLYIEKYSYKGSFVNEYPTTSKVGQSFEYLGTTARKFTQASNGGLNRYPVYGTNLTKLDSETDSEFTNLKQFILNENISLLSTGEKSLLEDCSNYNSMDSNGYLFLDGVPVLNDDGSQKRLFKHTAATGNYYGDVSETEQAIVKKINITSRSNSGNYITGLYAPAGEIIKIEISEQDLQDSGGFMIYIGQLLANGQSNDIWMARNFNRMPVIANKLPVNSTTCYVGSHLGGPIYIGAPKNSNASFSVTISGGVRYSHFILGLTSEEEFNENAKSSAPFFDLEVFDDSVRFSGPSKFAEDFTYSDLYKSAILWDKISLVSNKVPTVSNSSLGITFLFEPFVAAGEAVAFGGRNTVNCPESWMADCLNYNKFVTNGSWGNIHEYNHHYQRFGLPEGGEVTNNAVSLVSYSLFTKISAKRSLTDNTLGYGWERFTDPSRALKETLSISAEGKTNYSLSSYADILHAFGQDAFIKATQLGGGSSGVDVWFKAVSNATQHNMAYYFENILHQSVTESVKEEIANKNYPMFVPVASIYQTGRVYTADGKQQSVTTVQPFETEDDYLEFDLITNLVLPSGFTAEIKSVQNPENGTLQNLGDGKFKYNFASSSNTSGKFNVTLAITKTDGAFLVEDATLTLCFNKKDENSGAEFTSEYFYTREYTINSLEVEKTTSTIIDTNFVPWDESQGLDNMFDADPSNLMHSVQNVFISESQPFEITIKLDKDITTNKLTLFGRNYNPQTPVTFSLYGGLEETDLKLLGTFEDVELINNKDVSVTFELSTIRFYKLIVTKTSSNRYICLSGLEFSLSFDGGKQLSPDGFAYSGEWELEYGSSAFGHSYKTNKGKVEFEFTGKQFAIYSKSTSEIEFQISIDGSTFKTIKVEPKTVNFLSYLSEILSEGKHKVEIRSNSNFNLDHIVVR